MSIKCIIIDDEPLACDLLEDFISKVDYLDLRGAFHSAIEALNFMKTSKIDLVFLDIQMPEITGMEFLESLNSRPDIIFTTAYENYAVESYNFNAIDYLVKPFSFSRFLKAIDKLAVNYRIINGTEDQKDGSSLDYIFINNGNETLKLFTDDILFIQGMNDYIKIATESKSYIVRDNMKKAEELLSADHFIRIHKSYIISLKKLESVKGNTVKINNEEIPVGRLYKNAFQELLKSKKIG